MPRPKVHPSQRRRAAEACNFCRATKKRCSATAPCVTCQRKGKADSCYIPQRHGSFGSRPPPLPRPRVTSTSSEAVQRGATLLTPAPQPSPTANGLEQGHATSRTSNLYGSQSQGHENAPSSLPIAPPPGCEPHSRMLLNSRGERVYIGVAASISFLQLVRDTVVECIGPSQFSHNVTSDNMLETESPVSTSRPLVSSAIDLSFEEKQLFADVYLTAVRRLPFFEMRFGSMASTVRQPMAHQLTRYKVGGFLDVFTFSEIQGLLVAMNDPAINISAYKRASISLVIAIGAQCKSMTSSQQVGQPYFCQAQEIAFAAMLEDPSVDMVRMFLLMAFYMLGECRRNASFMYLGVASRAAVALGLHSMDSYIDMSIPRYQLRLRIWISLWVLDNLVCSILGRPSATAPLYSEMNSLVDLFGASTDHSAVCLIGSYRILRVINEAIEKLYDHKVISTKLVEELLDKIEKWRLSLPDSLCNPLSSELSEPTSKDKDNIANIHVSCLYYFAVTLVTRPFLISTLTTQSNVDSASHPQLALACLDAAVYLVQTCAHAHRVGLLLGNMCIMKALLFAAGLILGFDLFAKREIDYEVEFAFHQAKEVLEFLALQSPQAAHYGEILSLLTSAISNQREKLAARGRSSKLVKRLASFENIMSVGEHTTSTTTASRTGGERSRTGQDHSTLGMGRSAAAAAAATSNSSAAEGGFTTQHQQPHTSTATSSLPLMQNLNDLEGDPFLGWDSLDLLQWDNFPFMNSQSIPIVGIDVG